MITVTLRNNERADVFASGQYIGSVQISFNPFHAHHAHLKLNLAQYDPADAAELFSKLQAAIGHPLQIMVESEKTEIVKFITAGGFRRRRRCFEMVCRKEDLVQPVQQSLRLAEAYVGDASYAECCAILYKYYARTHARVSPVTVEPETFAQGLPEKVFLFRNGDAVLHCAFVDREEIAYVATLRESLFRPFAETLLATMLEQHPYVSFEADDTDAAAMDLRAFFRHSDTSSFDTYTLQ